MHSDNFRKGKQGESRGDFTRDTFDPFKHFSRVLMQQGRVQLDADWNEQISILVHYLRNLGADLIGPHGAPAQPNGKPGEGFKIVAQTPDNKDFNISSGHYYVDGILCENEKNNEASTDITLSYLKQPDYPLEENEGIASSFDYLVYLDVWERHISFVGDDYIREKALSGPDTSTRAKLVWQVKLKKLADIQILDPVLVPAKFNTNHEDFLKALSDEMKPGSGQLRARARKPKDNNNNPCLISPDARYLGSENQLYRVEIHLDSRAKDGPTFKWSRENGSVIFPIIEPVNGQIVKLENLGRDSSFGLKVNDWVEIVDDNYVLRNSAEPLIQVESVDTETLQVKLKATPISAGKDLEKHPYLRRWDQFIGTENGVALIEGKDENGWIKLEQGVEIQFPKPASEEVPKPIYQTGDYWLIPARAVTGEVEWPGPVDNPDALPPQGVDHHYAPLAIINVGIDGKISDPIKDLRRTIMQLWK